VGFSGEKESFGLRKAIPSESTEYRIIRETVKAKTRVLDFGCGNGYLLSILVDDKQVRGLGVDIDMDNVI